MTLDFGQKGLSYLDEEFNPKMVDIYRIQVVYPGIMVQADLKILEIWGKWNGNLDNSISELLRGTFPAQLVDMLPAAVQPSPKDVDRHSDGSYRISVVPEPGNIQFLGKIAFKLFSLFWHFNAK